jgi:O-antigen/teichoic acid export membrane protein
VAESAEQSLPAAAIPAVRHARIGRNVAALAGGQAVTWSMTLLWTLVVPRALGPTGMGLIVTAWSVTGVLGIVLGLGTRNFLVREMVVSPGDAPDLLGAALVLRLVTAPLFCAAVVVYAQVAHQGDDAATVLYLVGLSALLTLLAEPFQAGFQAIERMEYLAYSDVVNKSAQSLLGIALAFLGFRAVGIAGSMALMAAVVVVLNVVWLRGRMAVRLRTSTARVAYVARESLAYWAFGVFFFIYLWIDSVMLAQLTRPEVVGWYGVPMKLFQSLMFLPVVLSTAFLPRLVAAFGDGVERLRREARAPLELTIAASLPICAATAAAAGPAVHLLYGSAYDESAPVLVGLALCIPAMYLNIMLSYVLVAAKRQMAWTWVMVLATIVNPLFNLALIPFTQHRYGNGGIGAAVSLLLTELVIVAVGWHMVVRHSLDLRALGRVARVAVASGALWGVAHVLRGYGALPSLAAAGAAFLVLGALLRIATPAEIAHARALARRVRRRLPGASAA